MIIEIYPVGRMLIEDIDYHNNHAYDERKLFNIKNKTWRVYKGLNWQDVLFPLSQMRQAIESLSCNYNVYKRGPSIAYLGGTRYKLVYKRK